MNQLELISILYPLKRDLISDGYDQSLYIISDHNPITIHKFPTGSKCWTWTVPDKWTCNKGYIETLSGKKIIDYNDNPLYVASYSESIDKIVGKEELIEHLFVHPHCDDTPPFLFYYYQKNWAFGIERKILENLKDDKYHVVIESVREPGMLKVGEYFIQGESNKCFVICAHLDHPIQANDGLSGVVTGLSVMDELAKKNNKFSYRLLIVPETIGSIAWLSHNEDKIPDLIGGLFLEMTGLRMPPAIQLSYSGVTQIDKCLSNIHRRSEKGARIAKYREMSGNDERQFNAPGVRVPMLSYARAYPWNHKYFPFKEYHSSRDNLKIISEEQLEKSKIQILNMIEAVEKNYFPVNLFRGEVFLSGSGITVDRNKQLNIHRNMLKMIDMVDGTNSIADIASKLDIAFNEVFGFVEQLRAAKLVRRQEIY